MTMRAKLRTLFHPEFQSELLTVLGRGSVYPVNKKKSYIEGGGVHGSSMSETSLIQLVP